MKSSILGTISSYVQAKVIFLRSAVLMLGEGRWTDGLQRRKGCFILIWMNFSGLQYLIDFFIESPSTSWSIGVFTDEEGEAEIEKWNEKSETGSAKNAISDGGGQEHTTRQDTVDASFKTEVWTTWRYWPLQDIHIVELIRADNSYRNWQLVPNSLKRENIYRAYFR